MSDADLLEELKKIDTPTVTNVIATYPGHELSLDLYHPWALPAEEATALALASEAAARDVDERITNSDGAGVSTYQGSHVYGNTHGFIGSYTGTRHSVSCTVIAEQDEDKQRDYWFATSRRAAQLE